MGRGTLYAKDLLQAIPPLAIIDYLLNQLSKIRMQNKKDIAIGLAQQWESIIKTSNQEISL